MVARVTRGVTLALMRLLLERVEVLSGRFRALVNMWFEKWLP